VHKPNDPRTPRLFAIAEEHGLRGRYVALMEAVRREAEAATGKILPLNATGAIGALASELQIPWRIARGLGVMARAVGLVGHILEESREPMAAEIWARTEAAVDEVRLG
jgi:citrate synthase